VPDGVVAAVGAGPAGVCAGAGAVDSGAVGIEVDGVAAVGTVGVAADALAG
jgi:hypothetical protein